MSIEDRIAVLEERLESIVRTVNALLGMVNA
jgi:hypothetical protein